MCIYSFYERLVFLYVYLDRLIASWRCVGVFGSFLLVILQYSSSYQSRTKTSPAKVVEAEIS